MIIWYSRVDLYTLNYGGSNPNFPCNMGNCLMGMGKDRIFTKITNLG